MRRLESVRGKRLYLDTNFFIYGIEALPGYDLHVAPILELIDSGECAAVTSELALAEVLVKPMRDGQQTIANVYRSYIQTRETLLVKPITRELLIDAARCRAASGMKLMDAIHMATAMQSQCQYVVTEDRGFRPYGGIDILHITE